jgi:hypothetical protein
MLRQCEPDPRSPADDDDLCVRHSGKIEPS